MAIQQIAPQLQDGAEYIGKPVNPEYGPVPGSATKKEIRFYMEITEGPLLGRRVKYTANTKDDRSTAFAKRDLKAAGWQGATIKTFIADVTKMGESGVKIPFTVRLARNTKQVTQEDGSVKDVESTWWTVGTIGYSAVPLAAPTAEDDDLVDSWFAAVPDPTTQQAQGQQQTTQQSPPAAQRNGNGQGGHPNAPGNGRVPF